MNNGGRNSVLDGWKGMKAENKISSLAVWPVMFIILSSSQELLDILGDLLRFADDVLRAGKRGVRLHLQIIQLRDGAALSKPSAAPQPPPPANASVRKKIKE